jgi:VCBS repeat protein
MRVRAALIAAILIAWCRPAAAAVPPGSVIHVDRVIDLALFSRTVASRYDIVVRQAVTADIDRDGDLDVVAATDGGFDVWVNDGAGRLTSQAPQPHSPINADASSDTWRESASHREPPVQTHSPSVRAPTSRSHARPATDPRRSFGFDLSPDQTAACGVRVPRAPPSPQSPVLSLQS